MHFYCSRDIISLKGGDCIGIDFNGVDELIEDLNSAVDKVDELSEIDEIPLEELFTVEFMNAHSDFGNFFEMLSSFGYDINSQEDFDSIPEEELNMKISESTDFESFQDMLDEASSDYIQKHLNR